LQTFVVFHAAKQKQAAEASKIKETLPNTQKSDN
jgi:hypothetical protein